MLPDELRDILVCPLCKGPLQYDDTLHRLDCPPCGLGFPVRDGIPVMLKDEAVEIRKPGSDLPCPG